MVFCSCEVANFESCGRRLLLLQGNWEIWRDAALEGDMGYALGRMETVVEVKGGG
jgi:hypothetical protein